MNTIDYVDVDRHSIWGWRKNTFSDSFPIFVRTFGTSIPNSCHCFQLTLQWVFPFIGQTQIIYVITPVLYAFHPLDGNLNFPSVWWSWFCGKSPFFRQLNYHTVPCCPLYPIKSPQTTLCSCHQAASRYIPSTYNSHKNNPINTIQSINNPKYNPTFPSKKPHIQSQSSQHSHLGRCFFDGIPPRLPHRRRARHPWIPDSGMAAPRLPKRRSPVITKAVGICLGQRKIGYF